MLEIAGWVALIGVVAFLGLGVGFMMFVTLKMLWETRND